MITIKFPYHPFKIKEEEGKEIIFDETRKKWVRLTPEEWVRQNMIQFLVHSKKIPLKWIAVEKMIKLGDLNKRFDIVVMNASMEPYILIECKGPEIAINEEVLQQVLRYNISIPSKFLVITNGNDTWCWEKIDRSIQPVNDFPSL